MLTTSAAKLYRRDEGDRQRPRGENGCWGEGVLACRPRSLLCVCAWYVVCVFATTLSSQLCLTAGPCSGEEGQQRTNEESTFYPSMFTLPSCAVMLGVQQYLQYLFFFLLYPPPPTPRIGCHVCNWQPSLPTLLPSQASTKASTISTQTSITRGV